MSFAASIGTGFQNALYSADWRFWVDSHVGNAAFVGGVRFWLSLLGDAAMSFEVVDELSPLSDPMNAIFSRVLLRVV